MCASFYICLFRCRKTTSLLSNNTIFLSSLYRVCPGMNECFWGLKYEHKTVRLLLLTRFWFITAPGSIYMLKTSFIHFVNEIMNILESKPNFYMLWLLQLDVRGWSHCGTGVQWNNWSTSIKSGIRSFINHEHPYVFNNCASYKNDKETQALGSTI